MTNNIPSKVRQYVREELSGLYTISVVVVEKVNNENRRCEVSFKRDKAALVDDVPVCSPYADAAGNGLVAPVESGDEGLLFHSKAPNENLIVTPGHEDIKYNQRQFSPKDGFLLPMFWNEADTTAVQAVNDRSSPNTSFSMPYEKGEYLLVHEDAMIRIKPSGSLIIADKNDQLIKMDAEANETFIEHPNGEKVTVKSGEINLEGKQVNLGDIANAVSVLTKDAVFEYEDTQPDGSTTKKTTSTVSNGETTDTKMS